MIQLSYSQFLLLIQGQPLICHGLHYIRFAPYDLKTPKVLHLVILERERLLLLLRRLLTISLVLLLGEHRLIFILYLIDVVLEHARRLIMQAVLMPLSQVVELLVQLVLK